MPAPPARSPAPPAAPSEGDSRLAPTAPPTAASNTRLAPDRRGETGQDIPPEPGTVPRLAGDRFFARIVAAELECPGCGALLVVERLRPYQRPSITTPSSAGTGKKGGRPRASLGYQAVWNPYTQDIRCLICGRGFVLGVLAWSKPAGRVVRPEDVIPSPREALRLRQLAGGVWAAARLSVKSKYRRVNRIIDPTLPTCSCQVAEQQSVVIMVDPRCPIHGLYPPLTAEEHADASRKRPNPKSLALMRRHQRIAARLEEREAFWAHFTPKTPQTERSVPHPAQMVPPRSGGK